MAHLWLLTGTSELADPWLYLMVFLGREFECARKLKVYSSGKKSIFQNVHKITNFTIRSVTKKFCEHFQQMGPRNSRSSTPITL